MVEEFPEEVRPQIQEGLDKCLQEVGAKFDEIDINKDGAVERSELVTLAREKNAGEELSAEALAEIDQMIATFDANGDGKVSREEWNDFFTQLYFSVAKLGAAVQQAVTEAVAEAVAEAEAEAEAPQWDRPMNAISSDKDVWQANT